MTAIVEREGTPRMPKPKPLNLRKTVAQFRTAARALIDTQTTYLQNQTYNAPSLYHQLQQAIPGQQGNGGHASRSMPPLWISAVSTLQDIDKAIAQWLPMHDETTATRLACLIRLKSWKQHDAETLAGATKQLQDWTSKIHGLLEPSSIKSVSAPCPVCDTETVYRQDDAGETVRQPALQVITNHGCTCLQCGAHWAPEYFMFLCNKLLGFELPEGVLE